MKKETRIINEDIKDLEMLKQMALEKGKEEKAAEIDEEIERLKELKRNNGKVKRKR